MEGGPSDRIRTCGILLPKQARYQLRYTRLLSLFIRLVVFSQSKRATNCANPGFLVIEFCARCGQTCGHGDFLTISACGGSACIAGVSRDYGHGIFQLEGGATRSQSKRATNCANPGYEIQTDPTAGCSNSRVCLQNDYTTVPDRSTRGLPQKDGMQTKDYPLFY